MPNIAELVTAAGVAKVWNEKARERKPFLGEALFPTKVQTSRYMNTIKGGAQRVRVLNLSTFDAKAIPLDREGFDTIREKMPFFKNTLNVDEELSDTLKTISANNTAEVNAVVKEILDDQTTLLRNADVTREYLRMQALTGAISFSNNGVAVSVDYGIPSGNKVTLTSTAKWDAPSTADPIADINSLIETIAATGNPAPNAIIMNSVTFGLMKKTAAFKNATYVFANGTVTPNNRVAKEFVQDETGCIVYIYDKGITAANGTFTKFIADNKVFLVNTENLGYTRLATTPEETDLRAKLTADVSIVDGAVAITQYVTPDPVISTTKVSMICLPSLEGANSIGILTVA